jgi:hypothetical protein
MSRKRLEHTEEWLSTAQSALAALETAEPTAVRPFLETLATREISEPRSWRRLGRIVQDALAACDRGDIERVRAYLEAIRAVAGCAAEG